jgi:type II secretion system protein N
MAAPPPSRLPRWLVRAAYPIWGAVLTAFFIFLGFPYDQLAHRLSSQAEASMKMRVSIGEVSPHLGIAGPGLAVREVLAAPEGGRTIVLQELVVRPAWSLAWFRGDPAIHLDVTSEIGNGSGTIILGDRGGWDGSLDSVRVDYLPLDMLQAFEIDGLLDADVDLHGAPEEEGGGLLGTVDFELRDGSIGTEGLPVALPFDRLHGQLRFGDESYLTVSGVQIEGPLLHGTIEGRVGRGQPGRQPLSLAVSYTVRDEELARLFAGIGGRPDENGQSKLSISGTLSNPVIR